MAQVAELPAPSLHSGIEWTTLLERQVLELLSAAQVDRETAMAVLSAAKIHVEAIRPRRTLRWSTMQWQGQTMKFALQIPEGRCKAGSDL